VSKIVNFFPAVRVDQRLYEDLFFERIRAHADQASAVSGNSRSPRPPAMISARASASRSKRAGVVRITGPRHPAVPTRAAPISASKELNN